jgi:hypothetical protein
LYKGQYGVGFRWEETYPPENLTSKVLLKNYDFLTDDQKKALDIALHLANSIREADGCESEDILDKHPTEPKAKNTIETALQPAKTLKKQRKQRRSKYEDAVLERLHNIVEGVNKGYVSSEEFEDFSTVKSIAKYLQDNDNRFRKTKIESIEQYVGRSDAWKKRQEILKLCYGTMPPLLDEVYDKRTFTDTRLPDGVNDVDCSRKEYEAPVEDYLASLKHNVLLGKNTREAYISIVTNLTPNKIAQSLKEKEQFTDRNIETIEKGVQYSDAWRNREEILETKEYI